MLFVLGAIYHCYDWCCWWLILILFVKGINVCFCQAEKQTWDSSNFRVDERIMSHHRLSMMAIRNYEPISYCGTGVLLEVRLGHTIAIAAWFTMFPSTKHLFKLRLVIARGFRTQSFLWTSKVYGILGETKWHSVKSTQQNRVDLMDCWRDRWCVAQFLGFNMWQPSRAQVTRGPLSDSVHPSFGARQSWGSCAESLDPRNGGEIYVGLRSIIGA